MSALLSKALYLIKHPETAHGGDRKSSSKNRNLNNENTNRFTKYLSKGWTYMIEQEKRFQVPDYDDIVQRNGIEVLKKPGDLVIRNGDIAVSRWGDLMLVDEDYCVFFKLVQAWRYNVPTLKVLFEASIGSAQHGRDLEVEREDLAAQLSMSSRLPIPNQDDDAFHRTNVAIGAAEVARGVCAGPLFSITCCSRSVVISPRRLPDFGGALRWRKHMHKRLLSAAIMAMFATAPAFAATEYFVAQKASDKTCSVATTKPDGKTAMVVGKTSYKTEAEATAAMKAAAECKKK